MNKTLILAKPDDLDVFMGFIRPKLVAACKRSDGKWLVDDAIGLIQAGSWFLWIAKEGLEITGLCITEINQYPHARFLRFICATGIHAKDWAGFVRQIEAWGKKMGCVTSQIECRPGWEKLMSEFGYKKTHVILYRPL